MVWLSRRAGVRVPLGLRTPLTWWRVEATQYGGKFGYPPCREGAPAESGLHRVHAASFVGSSFQSTLRCSICRPRGLGGIQLGALRWRKAIAHFSHQHLEALLDGLERFTCTHRQVRLRFGGVQTCGPVVLLRAAWCRDSYECEPSSDNVVAYH